MNKEPKYIPFNVNHNIKVKLTELGYLKMAEIHNRYVNYAPNWELRTSDYYKSKVDSDGYTTFQMWSFMQDFGDVIHMGGPEYFNTTILIELDISKSRDPWTCDDCGNNVFNCKCQ